MSYSNLGRKAHKVPFDLQIGRQLSILTLLAQDPVMTPAKNGVCAVCNHDGAAYLLCLKMTTDPEGRRTMTELDVNDQPVAKETGVNWAATGL